MAWKHSGLFVPMVALVLYQLGGIFLFMGFILVTVMGGYDLLSWGDPRPFGYALLCIGASMSMAGVLVLRLVCTRGDCPFEDKANE
jgi:hypothetical protein